MAKPANTHKQDLGGSVLKVQAKTWWWYSLAIGLIAADQITKYWISSHMNLASSPWVFTDFFNFTLRHNYGAAFSIFHDAGGWQRYFLGGLALAVSLVLIIWISRVPSHKNWEAVALACVLGGAVGNLTDRIVLGYVVDFIVVHYKEYYWPAFNIADMAISCGALMLVIDAFMPYKSAPHAPSETINKQ